MLPVHCPEERMPVKASKSQRLVSHSRKIVHDKFLCIVAGLNYQTIPSIAENPVSNNPGSIKPTVKKAQ